MAETNANEAKSPLTMEQACELLHQHTARMNAEQYRLGSICNELVEQGVAGRHSYAGVELYLSPQLKELSRKDLHRAFNVARAFTEEECVKYGVRRLNLLVEYVLKFQLPWIPEDPGSRLIAVPCEDGTLQRKPFCECTEEELGRAISQQLPEPKGRAPRADAYCVQRLRDGLKKRLAQSSRVGVFASVRKGRVHLTLKNFSVTELESLVGALLESLEPLHEELYRQPPAQRPRPGPTAPPPPYKVASGHSQAER